MICIKEIKRISKQEYYKERGTVWRSNLVEHLYYKYLIGKYITYNIRVNNNNVNTELTLENSIKPK